jgi:hypothetical protein
MYAQNSSDTVASPQPPYYAVIFTSLRAEEDNGYEAMAQAMEESASRQDGFLGIDSVRDGKLASALPFPIGAMSRRLLRGSKQPIIFSRKSSAGSVGIAPIESASRGLSGPIALS